ncbi:MAG: serine/threonine-protein phosphatase, partial [bacterium]|nr:serine/threonine-protein phosphatase [bacterium]
MTWRFELATDIGGRLEQQDRAEVLATRDQSDDHLVVLADGMGGQQHGVVAAQAVIDMAEREFRYAPVTHPTRFLSDLCRKTHEAIADIGRQRQSDPASTCALLYVRGNEAYWVHVGDSRLYHFDGDKLLSRTRDHTVAELLKDNHDPGLTKRFADPADNRLYMCLGGQNDLQPEFGATTVGENDWFMLCSDGFWSQVEAEEIAHALTETADRKTAADFA